jgi:TonB family protein
MADAPSLPLVERPEAARLNAPEFLGTSPAPIPVAAPLPAAKSAESSPIVSEHPPEIVRQFSPVIPPNVLAMVKRRIDVRVRVAVDKDGKVVGSELMTPVPGAARYLGTAVLNAVRYWTFKPARRGQVPVQSELIVRFTFGS